MLIGFFPIAFMFLASYLLTLRWYERLGSIPALLLGAVAQPLFTALLFSFGVTYLSQFARNDNESPDSSVVLHSAFIASGLFAIVIAVPIALLATAPSQRRIRSQRPKEYYDSTEGFEVLVVIGIVSSLCAAVAVGCVWLLFWVFVA